MIQSSREGRILIVGGGANQIPLLLAAKNRGLFVAVSDINENPPCRKFADAYAKIDTVDRSATLEFAKAIGITAIATDQSDVAVPTVARIAEALGLPGIGFDIALGFTNKQVMRQRLSSLATIKMPESIFAKTFSEARKIVHDVENPRDWLVKPINSQGSKGVQRLDSSTVDDALHLALSEGRGKGVLLEQFIEGEEYSVEAITVSGRTFNLAVTKKYHYPENECIDLRNTYLDDVGSSIESSLFKANHAVVGQLGLVSGSTHAEFKMHRGQPVLMEIAARGGGGNISGKIIPYLTGFEPSAALVSLALGEIPQVAYLDYKSRFAIMSFFNFKKGIVSSLENSIDDCQLLLHFELNLQVGDRINQIKSSRDRPGYFIVSGSSCDNAISNEKRILESVRVEVG